ncbi:ATP-binding cassette domain-containing protein [Intestinibaculum porci]|uniref:ABC transporter n=1 Tax=Intestinibaculum porci TaxID=2487118 RepID=A0A3G9JLP3_9FIRM|nr:ATP-binding cassette domain-containing protein [Intestinibaculum porci]MDD6349247.1 ATP-binding cassette domain-containing protein [Intestinibaculum porci]MDD6421963.1 ATP-binding cassette domain-containing protein [Intestinibaculum porci]BBH25923.1 ABC transporter [Intestinibaculum porci]HAN57657.1 hypothetical protein [Erysipelotrichaceae bacterium]
MLVKHPHYYTDDSILNPLINDQKDYTQYICLCGANGSGRDVLLKQIERSFSAKHLEDFFHDDIEHLAFAAKDIGLLLEYPEEQMLDMNVLFNVMNSLFTFNYTLSNTHRKASDALTFVGIKPEDFRKDPRSLSLYEQRKMILASFLAIDTKIIIIDNPTADLNENEKEDLVHLLYELNTSKNRTVIMLTSHAHDIMNFTDQVFGFKDGQLSLLGKPSEYHDHPSPLSHQEEEVLHEIIYHAEIDL